MLLSLINLFLSPFCLLIFLFYSDGKQSKYYTKLETNVYKLKPMPYLFYSLIYISVIIGLLFIFKLILNCEFDVWQVFYPKNLWVTILTWFITVVALYAYSKGMEMNIMGFIFFPLMFITVLLLIGINALDFWHFFKNCFIS